MLTGARLDVGQRADARSRLLSDLAAAPARKGYGIAYDLLGNRAEAEEAVQEARARVRVDRGPPRSGRRAGLVPAHRDDDVLADAAPAPVAAPAVRLAAGQGG